MLVLLEVKEWLKSFYGKYALLMDALFKFCVSLAALILLNNNLGYMVWMKNPLILILLALVCGFVPYGAISLLMGALLLGQIYAVSFELSILIAVFLTLVALLYYGLQPRDSYWLILTPIAFALKIPFVIPLLAGLSGSINSVIPVSFGVTVHYIMLYVKQNAGVLTNDTSVEITEKYVQMIKVLMSNQTMMIMIAVCTAGILIVYLLRILSVDYAWVLAIIMGSVAQIAVVFVGDYLFDVHISMIELIIGLLVSMVIAGLYHFFVFAVDYSRTEYTQFEDDDYVYYVKAVPKVVVSKPDVRVQRINDPKKVRRSGRRESEAGL